MEASSSLKLANHCPLFWVAWTRQRRSHTSSVCLMQPHSQIGDSRRLPLRDPRIHSLAGSSPTPHLLLREINPAFCQDWMSLLRGQVEAGLMKLRTFNRWIAAISSMYC